MTNAGLAQEDLECLTEIFTVVTRGASVFAPEVFDAFSDALAKRIPHDSIAVMVLDPRGPELRVAAVTGRGVAIEHDRGPQAPVPLSDAVAALFTSEEPVYSDDTTSAGHPFNAAYLARGIRSFAMVPVPTDPTLVRAWLIIAWSEPGRASAAPHDLLARVGLLLRAVVPSAHYYARAQRLAALLDRVPHGVIALDARSRVAEANGAARALLADSAAIAGEEFLTLLHPSAHAAFTQLLAALPGSLAVPLVLANGRLADVRAARVPQPDPIAVQLFLDDAQPRVAGEIELGRRAEARLFLLELAQTVAGERDAGQALARAAALIAQRLPVAGVALARLGAAGLELVAAQGISDAALAAFLGPRGAPLGAEGADGLWPVAPELRAALAPRTAAIHGPLRHADRTVGAALFLVPADADDATRELLRSAMHSLAVALHASVEYTEALRLAAERRQLLDSIPNIVFRLAPESGATLYANAALERVLGVPVAAALGVPGLEGLLCDGAEREAMESTRRAVAAGSESVWCDRRFRRRDGRVVVLRVRMYPMPDGVIEGIAQDVTEEHEARQRLVQADRLASLGMLAAGVAHEINNPTAFILLGVQQLGRMVAQLPEEDPHATLRRRMAEVCDELTEGVQRIVQIVGELKLFARIPESAFSTPVDVNRLLVSAVTLAQAELRHRARVEVDLGELPPLPGDHARLGQVFVNLLINAAQAIPAGDEDENLVCVRTRARGDDVVVEISDTGVGIPTEHLPRIFDPFFTTKPPGEGTGLGLAISFDLVRRAGGTIRVESAVGRGTTFTVVLPVREARLMDAEEARQPVAEAVDSGRRVLIVEDEPHLAAAIARALAARYQVERCPDGEAALALLDVAADFDAILCDLRMPGLDGRAFYQAVSDRYPQLARRFVFLTGAGLGSEFEPFVRATDRPVLEKPFEMLELENAVEKVVRS